MADVVVTVPKHLWQEWIAEGDLPGDEWSGYESHFTFSGPPPNIGRGDRVYIVAHGRLRGYAPLHQVEIGCRLKPGRNCLLRRGNAVAVTISVPIRGFQGWRYRWWDRSQEVPFPNWRHANVS